MFRFQRFTQHSHYNLGIKRLPAPRCQEPFDTYLPSSNYPDASKLSEVTPRFMPSIQMKQSSVSRHLMKIPICGRVTVCADVVINFCLWRRGPHFWCALIALLFRQIVCRSIAASDRCRVPRGRTPPSIHEETKEHEEADPQDSTSYCNGCHSSGTQILPA